jgi:hypothetical protein
MLLKKARLKDCSQIVGPVASKTASAENKL